MQRFWGGHGARMHCTCCNWQICPCGHAFACNDETKYSCIQFILIIILIYTVKFNFWWMATFHCKLPKNKRELNNNDLVYVYHGKGGGPFLLITHQTCSFLEYGSNTQVWYHHDVIILIMMSFLPPNDIYTPNALKSIHKCTKDWRDNILELCLHRPQVGLL